MNEVTIPIVGPNNTDPKMWYLSVELWTASVAIVAFIAQGMGYIETGIPNEIQASFVMIIMFLLRGFRTKNPVAWSKKQFEKMKGVA